MAENQNSNARKFSTSPFSLDNLLSYKVAWLILAFLNFTDILLLLSQNVSLASSDLLSYSYPQLLLALFFLTGLFGIFLRFAAKVQFQLFSLSLFVSNLFSSADSVAKKYKELRRYCIADNLILDFALSQNHDGLLQYRIQELSGRSEHRLQSLLMFTLGILLLLTAFLPRSSIYQLISQGSGLNIVVFFSGFALTIYSESRSTRYSTI